MNRKQEIRKALIPLQAELAEIEKAETRAKNQALVGKCFKYRNSFGGDSGSWWLYVLVVDAGDYWPVAWGFQTDSNGRFEVEPNKSFVGSDGYTEITRGEFDGAWEDFITEVNALQEEFAAKLSASTK